MFFDDFKSFVPREMKWDQIYNETSGFYIACSEYGVTTIYDRSKNIFIQIGFREDLAGYPVNYRDYIFSQKFNTFKEAVNAYYNGNFFNDDLISKLNKIPYLKQKIKNRKFYEKVKEICDQSNVLDVVLIDRHMYSMFDVIIYIPEITITNAQGDSHLIKGLVSRFQYRVDTFSRYNFITRTMSSPEENMASGYMHSHCQGNYLNSYSHAQTCWIDENDDIYQMLNSADTFDEGITKFVALLSWESIDGVPHIHMKDIYKKEENSRSMRNDIGLHISTMIKYNIDDYIEAINIENHDISNVDQIQISIDPVKFYEVTEKLHPEFIEAFKSHFVHVDNAGHENRIERTRYVININGNREKHIKYLKGQFLDNYTLKFKNKRITRELYNVIPETEEEEELKPNAFNSASIMHIKQSIQGKIKNFINEQIKLYSKSRNQSKTIALNKSNGRSSNINAPCQIQER